MRRALALPAVLLVAGCGGPGKTANVAELVPASTRALTIVRSAQAAQARRVSRELHSVDVPRVPPGAGPELVAARLDAGVVYFTQPHDAKAFRAAHALSANVRGWVAFSGSQAALDAVRHRKRTLAGLAPLPVHAALREWEPHRRATALTLEGRRATLEVRTRAVGSVPQVASLVDAVPADALAAAGGSQLPQRVRDALGAETAGWVRGGLPFPELTVVSQSGTMRGATRGVDALAQTDAPATPYGSFRRLSLGAADIFWGRSGGRLVVTDDASALQQHGKRLSLDALPPRVEGWLYVDVERALPVAEAFRRFANWRPPARLEALRPFRSYLLYTRRDGAVENVVTTVESR